MICGVLPEIDKQVLLLERWLGAYLPEIDDPGRARVIRQYAIWQVQPCGGEHDRRTMANTAALAGIDHTASTWRRPGASATGSGSATWVT